MLFNSLGDSIDLFLIGMGFNNVVLLLQITVIPIHFICCWFFISVNELGVEGAAFASNLTALLTLICQIIYVNRLEGVREAWYAPTRKTLQNLIPFMQLALPGTLMLFLENMNMEVLIILAGLYNDVNILAAMVILVAFGQFLIMIPYGLSLATVTTVGHSLGGNKPTEAIANCKMIACSTTAMTFLVALVMFCI